MIHSGDGSKFQLQTKSVSHSIAIDQGISFELCMHTRFYYRFERKSRLLNGTQQFVYKEEEEEKNTSNNLIFTISFCIFAMGDLTQQKRQTQGKQYVNHFIAISNLKSFAF